MNNGSLDQSLLANKDIIDMHVHVAGVGADGSGCHVSPKLRKNWRYKSYLKAFNLTEREMKLHGDRLVFQRLSEMLDQSRGVKAAVVLALDGVIDEAGELDLTQTETYVPNDFVASGITRYPNLLYGASVNPYRHDALQRLEQAKADGAVLIKWLPAIQQIDPSDQRIIPFYNKLVELKLVLLTHAGGERSFTTASEHLGDPELLRLPLSLGVKVVAAHAATTGKSDGEENMQRLLRMFPEYPNLYADISSLTQINKLRYLPRLLQHDVHDRLIYGTDFPLINTPLVSPWHYPKSLSLRQMRRIAAVDSPWDRDLLIKAALGTPREVFYRWGELLSD
ncbi:MAG: amidohydrolase family protein [Desulfuromonadales bacterium]|nr:amidohydrolase family protein [Desulfuromonadales bacterium]